MFLKIGLRNVLRNKRRSFLSCLAIGVGLAALIFTDGFMLGMKESVVRNVTESYLGHAQIHSKGYRINPEIHDTVGNYKGLKSFLDNSDKVDRWAARVNSPGMISTASNILNTQIVGVDPEKERRFSKIEESLVEGKFLENGSNILIGKELARKLDVRIGEKLVLTAAQLNTGDLSQELFRVSGIFSFGSKQQDSGMVFITSNKLLNMLHMEKKYHEIAIKFKDLSISKSKLDPIWKKLDSFGDYDVESWSDLIPGIMSALSMSEQSMGYIAIFLLVIVLLGILNNLFMSIFERMFEFGVIRAIGTRPFNVFKMILSEAMWLALFSVIMGFLVAICCAYLVNINGIDYSGVEMGETTLREPIYYIANTYQFIYYPILVFVFTFVSAVYPGIFAAKITLSDAMKKSL